MISLIRNMIEPIKTIKVCLFCRNKNEGYICTRFSGDYLPTGRQGSVGFPMSTGTGTASAFL